MVRIELKGKTHEEQIEWMKKAFIRIIDKCKLKKIKSYELELDYRW